MTLKSRSALVTGSTSGIGLACARALAAEGRTSASTDSARRTRSRRPAQESKRNTASAAFTTART